MKKPFAETAKILIDSGREEKKDKPVSLRWHYPDQVLGYYLSHPFYPAFDGLARENTPNGFIKN